MGTEEERGAEREVSRVVLIATPWWIKSRRDNGEDPNPKLTELMHLLFRTLDAMYLKLESFLFPPEAE